MRREKARMNWSKTSSGRWAAALIAAIGMVFIWLAVYCVRKTGHGEVGDFGAYYVAAQALCRHGDPYLFSVKPYIYPPLFATLCMPLASLPMTTAAALYVPVMVAAVLLSLFWGARDMMDRFDLPPRTLLMAAIIVVTLLIMEDRIKSELQMFQV